MSGRKKVKPRQQRKPRAVRNFMLMQNILQNKGGPHEDRRNKRERQRGNNWEEEDWGEDDE